MPLSKAMSAALRLTDTTPAVPANDNGPLRAATDTEYRRTAAIAADTSLDRNVIPFRRAEASLRSARPLRTYDGLGQLLTNTGSWGTGNAVYDSLGNIHSRKLGPRTIDLQYDSNNRVYQSIDSQAKPIAGAAKVNGWGADGTDIRTVDYDDRGNVTTLGTMSFYYDYSDQPTVVSGTKTDGTSLTGNYRYDGNLRRVRNQVNGKTIYNVFDASGALVHTRDFGNNKTADYIRANGETVARWGQGHWVFDHKDHLGSTVAATHMNGNVNARMRYAPFGLAMDDPTKLRDGAGFTGHLKGEVGIDLGNQFRVNETGLNKCNLCLIDFRNWTFFVHFLKASIIIKHKIHDMQARYYDPVMGRFLSIDPMTMMDTGMNPGMFNRFAYTFNDPINHTDPDGEFANVIAGAAIGGLVGGIVSGTSAALKGHDLKTIATQAAIGASSGAITGAVAGSGAGLIGLAGKGLAQGLTKQAAIRQVAVNNSITGGLYGASSGALGTVVDAKANGEQITGTDLLLGAAAGGVTGAIPIKIPGTDQVLAGVGNTIAKDIVEVGLDVAVGIATDAGAGKITEEVDERIDDEGR